MSLVGVHGRVDDTDHSLLAMLALGAVEPDGIGVVDHDREDWLGLAHLSRHETREEALHARHYVLNGHTRLSECRLCDGVVLKSNVSSCSLLQYSLQHTIGLN